MNEGSYVIKWGLYYLQRDSNDVFAGKALARRFVSRESAERFVRDRETTRFNGDLKIVHLLPRGTIARRERRTIRDAIKRVSEDVHGPIRFWFERLIEELS